MIPPISSHGQELIANGLSGAEVDGGAPLVHLRSAQTLNKVYILVVPTMMDCIRELDLLPSFKDEVAFWPRHSRAVLDAGSYQGT